MAMIRQSVVLDSSALVALLKLDDADHAVATDMMDRVIFSRGLPALLPLEVLAETLNILGKKQGKQAAIAGGRVLLEYENSGELSFIKSSNSTLAQALDLQTIATGGPSFVDCLVMAHASQRQTPYIFGFDAVFKRNGYRLPDK